MLLWKVSLPKLYGKRGHRERGYKIRPPVFFSFAFADRYRPGTTFYIIIRPPTERCSPLRSVIILHASVVTMTYSSPLLSSLLFYLFSRLSGYDDIFLTPGLA